MQKTDNFTYKLCGVDRVIDEKGSSFIALRSIAWNTDPETPIEDIDPKNIKLDLRKYYATENGEKMNKGVSFLTDEGPTELVHVLLDEGYGNTIDCLNTLKDRDDFNDAVKFIFAPSDEKSSSDDEYFDPRELLMMSDTTDSEDNELPFN